jgi:type II secretory pathway predicted ATPase ExeA
MYYDYFGLKQPPFRITPDTSLFYPGGDRGAVLDALIYAILNGEGMVKVVGEVGSGKTMLCRMLEKELPDKVEVVYLANPSLSPENILHAIAFELKLSVKPDTSRLQVMHDLQEYLLKRHAENRQVVVFVEEAQAMPIATLEEIRLLSNLETQQSKLLQIALFGQPELDELIANPEIRQLKERITYSFQLNPFVSEHIRDYVSTRLRASGYRAGEIFDKAAIRKIEHYSKGLLRRVNILADKSLLAAYADNMHEVTARHVKQAARDSEFISNKRGFNWIALITASILLVILGLAGYWQSLSGEKEAKTGTEKQTSELAAKIASPVTIQAEIQSEVYAEKVNIGPEEMAGQLLPAAVEKVLETLPAKTAESNKTQSETGSYTKVEKQKLLNSSTSRTQDSAQEFVTTTALTLEKAEPGNLDDSSSSQIDEFTMRIGGESEAVGQLLDLSMLFQIQDLGDARLSDQESALLRKQLKELPPEVALYDDSSQFSDICRLCSSILYRPLRQPENL